MFEQTNTGRPRVALIADYPPDHATFTSGVQTATDGLLEGLMAHQTDFEFHVISLAASIPADIHEQRNGFDFHFLRLPTVRWIPTRAPFRIYKIWRELRRIRPALVHCNTNSFAPLAVILGGYRRILTIHGVSQHEAHLQTGRVPGNATADVLIERYVHDHFEAVICISRYAANFVGKQATTFAIPNPVGSIFLRDRARSSDQDRPRLVFIGLISPLKRPADLVAAHTRLRGQFPTVHTVLCGRTEDAGYAENLRRMIRDEHVEGVQFVDRASRDQTAELLRSAAVLVVPSAQENTPMVIAEAMAVGVPVVATRVGGIPEMVREGETGFLYEPGDVEGLTSRLRQLLADPALRERFGLAARELAQTSYAPASVARATVEAYRWLLSRRLPRETA